MEVHVGKKGWKETGEESCTKMLKETKVRISKVIQRRRKWEKVKRFKGTTCAPAGVGNEGSRPICHGQYPANP